MSMCTIVTILWLWSCFRTEEDRDVFNEKPSKEELVAATQVRELIIGSYHTQCTVIWPPSYLTEAPQEYVCSRCV